MLHSTRSTALAVLALFTSASCGKLTPQGGNPTMTLLRDGSEKVCVAADVQAELRNLIVPKASEITDTEADAATLSKAAGQVSLSYELTTLQSFDQTVVKASCNTTVSVRGAGDKTEKFHVDYAISPAADDTTSLVVTGDVEGARAFAKSIISQDVEDAMAREEDEQIAASDAEEKVKLLAIVNERWLTGAWIETNQPSAYCGNGEAMWFQPGHTIEGKVQNGRWALNEDQLHIIGPAGADLNATITQADAVSFKLVWSNGETNSVRRCTRAETETLPDATEATDAGTGA